MSIRPHWIHSVDLIENWICLNQYQGFIEWQRYIGWARKLLASTSHTYNTFLLAINVISREFNVMMKRNCETRRGSSTANEEKGTEL